MGAHLRNGRNISLEQQQRELQRREREQQPEDRAGDGPPRLQRGDDQRYSFSPAAAERLRRLRLQSSISYRHRYETTGGRNFEFGARNFTCLNQLEGTSLALETASNRSTPVPCPVDRLVFPVNSTTVTGRSILAPTPLLPNPNRFPAPLGLDDIIVDNQELETVIHLFNKQWNTFVQARENQNTQLMRMALVQAISSQEEIRLLAGGAEMLRICENWIAREELADLERSEAATQSQATQRLAITQTAHQHTISPSPAPQRSIRQSSDVTYLGTGQVQQQSNPPPSTPHPSEVARQTQHYQQQPLNHYQQRGYHNPQPQQERFVQNYAPPQHQEVQVAQNHGFQQPPRPPRQGNWRGSGRNRRRPQDQMTRLLEVGEYLMRAERIAGRVFRDHARGRGRGSRRRGPPRQEEPPAEHHQ
ncbi:uncharacterized protein PGTG_14251 [Puccinia graminis f. sp. tritici CRL 75-36-700-3]|uniref:Uncharacterized protein n=1 Tax=Puccinia graminis f. sp. tritici (strain CRL 75-36-700-3 / race SCCL) TaxID=418459 RepID=E3KV72_PUCGT|nr:uncharacterized protein PGTG_14251 [Puccinia graminis f. sp. tritici CRL 75-36-700-3]EFP88167.1 hypothetical protein PGTG_14251 [Puccinia graminis f. sp. tritici CRL 75-36-700-3]